MAIKKKPKDAPAAPACAALQTASSSHPFTALSAYIPGTAQVQLFRSLREGVPIIDAAIGKLARLLGTFRVECANKSAERALTDFFATVRVGGMQQGIQAFLSTFFETLLTYGTAVGEMALTGGQISHLYVADPASVHLRADDSPLNVEVLTRDDQGRPVPVRYPALILKCAHAPEPGRVYGTSVLRGLPFVSDVLLKIFHTVGLNWERAGNVRFAVTYQPPNDAVDRAYTKERAACIAEEWSKTMAPGAGVRDFVAVGDVSIRAIGADSQILDSTVPVRQLLEQIVAKLGVPPFLLGLSWSSTERMSTQQADLLTSEIDFYRRELEPVIRQIADLFLRLNGTPTPVSIQWEDLTLQDITELSRSALYDAQAEKLRRDCADRAPNEPKGGTAV